MLDPAVVGYWNWQRESSSGWPTIPALSDNIGREMHGGVAQVARATVS